MNYPVWELGALGGGFWIALVAILHVFVAHFAVGGGLWLVTTEIRARRTGDAALRGYLKGHAKFFLLMTLVFGGLSGVGIWWTISLLSPGATSLLIHTFVFGWAIEWVFFVAEIVALLIYYYRFDTMKARDHEIVGWFYFLFAWLSLFMINGIIGFMLTTGQWPQTGNFWDGFFNESFWPQLVFRSALSFMIAGMFGLLTGAWQRDPGLRQRVVRYSAWWVIAPFVVLMLSGLWYVRILPEAQSMMVLDRAREVAPWLRRFLWITPLILVGGVLALVRLPAAAQRLLAGLVVLAGLLQMGSFEFVREAGRRPYVIHGIMYSNQVLVSQVEELEGASFLAAARWSHHKQVTEANLLAAGEELFRLQCATCHSVRGPMNDIVPVTRDFTQAGLEAQFVGQGRVALYMPPFFGDASERRALASYLLQVVHGHDPEPEPVPMTPRDLAVEVPPFDPDQDRYVLLAWNNTGMHCLSDGDPWYTFLPPGNMLHAQLIQRGESPLVVSEGVTITYTIEAGFENPEQHVRYWEFARANFGLERDLEPGVGRTGNRISGVMVADPQRAMFVASRLPVVPFQDGEFHPYPLYTLEARDAESGELLAATRAVAPVSSEMGCTNCHGGGWRVDGLAGVSDETGRRVLRVHDKHSGTDLLQQAEAGEPRSCKSCHEDPGLGFAGQPGLLNFSAAIHGWHANYLTDRGADACAMCHPADRNGPTDCLRGAHARSLDCTHCHGALEDHALSLLVAESAADKPGAATLMQHLRPQIAASAAAIAGRLPWVQEPDCVGCHTEDYERPDPATASAFNQWVAGVEDLYRMRTDDTGVLQCQACHGSTHAEYPAVNRWYGADRDNLQPLQYQGNRRAIGADGGCIVCHGVEMDFSVHHAGMTENW